MSEDRDSKTESATARQRERFRSEGKVPISSELVSIVVFMSAALVFVIVSAHSLTYLRRTTSSILGHLEYGEPGSPWNHTWITEVATTAAWLIFPVGSASALAALVTGFAQTRGLLALEALKFDITRLNPLPRLAQLFASKQALVSILQSLGKVSVVGILTYQAYTVEIPRFLNIGRSSVDHVVHHLSLALLRVAGKISAALIVFAVIDYAVTRHRSEESMKMTKEEVRKEHREAEGSPEVKRRQRKRAQEMGRNRMVARVADADVVIVNPTHYAVALKYHAAAMAAPRVVAKGRDDIALKIRAIAREHHIPVLHNPPLARGLHAACGIDHEVPANLYAAVAEVLAFVYQLGKKSQNDVGDLGSDFR